MPYSLLEEHINIFDTENKYCLLLICTCTSHSLTLPFFSEQNPEFLHK